MPRRRSAPAKNSRKTGRQFEKGKSGNPKGRPKGSPNKVTKEARELCRHIVEDASYQAALLKRANAGRLHPVLEAKLWDHGGVTPMLPPLGDTPPMRGGQAQLGSAPITVEFELVSDTPAPALPAPQPKPEAP